MEFREASQEQQSLVAAVVAFILELLRPYRQTPLTNDAWLALLRLAYPRVAEARYRSAQLARSFYDSQRERHPGERHDTYLAEYECDWFVEAMEPVRDAMIRDDTPDEAVAQAALYAAKEIENGWRRTLIRAVQSDPSPRRVRWARVATGRETCGFCMMLVSRGPVYLSARSAGLNADDTRAKELFRKADQEHGESAQLAEEAMDALMTRWHAGCDCRVVPVFDTNNWPGRAAYLRAEALWRKVTKGTTNNRDAMNAVRRAVESGDLDVSELAAA